MRRRGGSLDPAVRRPAFLSRGTRLLDCDPPPPAEMRLLRRQRLAGSGSSRATIARLNAVMAPRCCRRKPPTRARSGQARRTGSRRLRRSQRAWLLLRDDNCDLESWESPNRWAHSIYATQWAPCVHAETRARMEWLSATYRVGGGHAMILLVVALTIEAPEIPSIPAEFRGRWAATAQLCAEPDGFVEIRIDGMDYAASAVRPVAATPSTDRLSPSRRGRWRKARGSTSRSDCAATARAASSNGTESCKPISAARATQTAGASAAAAHSWRSASIGFSEAARARREIAEDDADQRRDAERDQR